MMRSRDPHQEETFATLELVAPCYSTLLQIDPLRYPRIIGDVATEWKIGADGLTYTFKLRQGIRFHDGSALTSADVKATYEKIVSPPPGVRSIRRNAYAAITADRSSQSLAIICCEFTKSIARSSSPPQGGRRARRVDRHAVRRAPRSQLPWQHVHTDL